MVLQIQHHLGHQQVAIAQMDIHSQLIQVLVLVILLG
jgi:hypothetical protein